MRVRPAYVGSSTMAKEGFVSVTVGLLKESVSAWSDHKAPKMGAALAYYTAFSLAPLIIFMLSLVSLVIKRDDAARGIVAEMSDLIGADGGKVVQDILDHSSTTAALSWGTGLSFLLLVVSASGAFGELQDSLNTIWEVPKQKHPWLAMIKDRLLSLSMVFVLGFFLLTSLLFSAFITGLTNWWFGAGFKFGLELANTVISFLVISGLFGFIFRFLPDCTLHWRDVWPGAVFSSALFIIGKFLLGLYISHSAFASSYGAAASFVVILVWVFYSAQIIYFGAEFTRAYTRRFGSHQESLDTPPLKKRVTEAAASVG
jgi:membrane protein